MAKVSKVLLKFHIRKKDFQELMKNQTSYCAITERSNVLAGVNFECEDNILRLASTDGNRLLQTNIQLESYYVEKVSNFENAIYMGNYLRNIKFLKSLLGVDKYIDNLEVTLTKEKMLILDISNKINYEIPAIEGTYPPYKQLLPEKTEAHYEIGINVSYLEQLKNLSMGINERTNILKMRFNKENPLTAVVFEAENYGITQKTLVMPVQLRNKNV